MKKRLLSIVIAFVLCVSLIKYLDIIGKYEIDIVDYLRYSLPLTAAEKKILQSEDIQYGIDINDAPFAFVYGDTSQNTGILVDYFNQLSVTLETNFQPVSYDSYNLAVKLKDGLIDAAVLNKTPMNKEVFLFTQPLYTERSKILVKGESEMEFISDVEGITIAVIAGTTAHHAANEFFAGSDSVRLILTNGLDESFYLFGMGEVDAVLGNEAKISYHLNQGIKDNRFRFLTGAVSEEEVGVAVNKEEKALYSILNKGILELKKNSQYSHIHSKWFGSFIPEVKDVSDYGATANVVILLLCVAFVFVVWNQTVSNRVNVRTRELQESREELRNILDSLVDGIIVTDSAGNIQVCNQTALKLLDAEPRAVMEKNIRSIAGLQPYLEHVNQPEAFKNGSRYYLTSKRKLDGVAEKSLVVIEDYTTRYKYESLTRQKAKMIAVGELSAGLAHEIRNPLGLIKSYVYLIRKRLPAGTDLHPFNVIDDSVDRINNLIENLLGFSRLSMEKSTEVDVKGLITSIVALEHKNLEKYDIEIELAFHLKEGSRRKLNEDVLKLTMVNLINNSIEALAAVNRRQKRIRIEVTEAEGKLHVTFSDNGNGIPQENLEAVFNPFFTTKETGTGLGLYILHSEIRGIDGAILVESDEGEGTTFRVTFPTEREGSDGKQKEKLQDPDR